jgi:hypothetical protein
MDKVILVKELKSGKTKGDTPQDYLIPVDQDNDQWHLFRQTCPIELNKVYLMTFHLNEKGYKEVEKVTPLVNIFKAKALKEVANRNDITKNLAVATSYSIQLLVSDKIKLDELFDYSKKIYDFIQQKTDEELDKLNKKDN